MDACSEGRPGLVEGKRHAAQKDVAATTQGSHRTHAHRNCCPEGAEGLGHLGQAQQGRQGLKPG